ncbi:hypothetical protein MKW98_005159 [Papaver atlanticum]|uniref:Uncharacterized protein n=1 Tax=Papaver atlanticum TaxID=357466 RepID=A0AAD4X4V5_9MAGN|nr:hypothetical protein MKW98_005159 [Papaver atlanticum]
MILSEKPHFFVGIVWVDLLLQWPICISNVYGIVNKKIMVLTTTKSSTVNLATRPPKGKIIEA